MIGPRLGVTIKTVKENVYLTSAVEVALRFVRFASLE
jgi:hypothetical protein